MVIATSHGDGHGASAGSGGAEEAEAALDATAAELSHALGVVQVACMPSLDQVTLVRHQGSLPLPRLTEAMQRALSGCTLLHEQMANAIKAKVAGEKGQEGTTGAPIADADNEVEKVVALQHFGEAMVEGASRKRGRAA